MSEKEIVKTLKITLKQETIEKVIQFLSQNSSRTIWLAGNGGSCYNASHMASDLENIGYNTRCMNLNVARILAIANDAGWEKVYEYQMWNFSQGDVLIVFSVHGGTKRNGKVWSNNLVRACEIAKSKQGTVIALLGGNGGMIKDIAHISLIVSHLEAWAVEGIHCVLTHLICEKLKENKNEQNY